jgi:hypothetical protein
MRAAKVDWAVKVEQLAPADWYPAPPDFVGIGVQKAGTTWWYRLIESHPQVFTAHWKKELHFFDQFGFREFDTAHHSALYAQQFPRPLGGVTGEWTPRYMSNFWVAPLLKIAAPDTKLLVLTRDPVRRYLSGVRHARNAESLSMKLALALAFQRGFYFEQLSGYLRHFHRAQILVQQYEQCLADPRGEIRRTFEFLGLDSGHVPPNVDVRFNESKGRPFVGSAQAREELAELYRDDACRLAETFDLDLSLWPSIASTPA